MKKSRQILAVLLCAAMVMALVPAVSVSAESCSGWFGDNVTWELDTSTGVLTISGMGDMEHYWISSIPWEWEEDEFLPETMPWYYYRESITSAVISNGVTSVGQLAFYGCKNLTSVEIPDSVTKIDDYAFSGCSSLTSVNIPDSVTSIDECAFSDCTALTSVTIPDSVTYLSYNVFSGCSSLTSVTIGDGATGIYSEAFSDSAYYNDEANWEDGVLYIGKHLIDVKTDIEGDYEIKSG
ncbi:MAG: leucine-rich repeat domain-containing protein, partial [Clostridia bacterium]|nr:leucine-rich repeat domain-containing protein [Clostridia bacterium]